MVPTMITNGNKTTFKKTITINKYVKLLGKRNGLLLLHQASVS